MSLPLTDHMVPATRRPESVDSTASEFGAFYERWHNQLLGHVRRTIGARDSDEITQETMARALTSLDLTRDAESQWRWLRVVARNVATDLARSRKLCDVASEAPCDVERPARTDVEQQLLDSECLQELHHVLTALSPKQSQAWWLTIAEGMPPTAIAATMQCSPESVRQALFKTRHRVASAMAYFCERVEGFGAFGVLAFLGRKLRKSTQSVGRASAPTTLAFAAVGMVGTLAVLSIPAHLGSVVHTPATRHPAWHDAAHRTVSPKAKSVEHAMKRSARPNASVNTGGGIATHVARPAATAFVSPHPLRTGRTITVQVDLKTPVGEEHVGLTSNRGTGTGAACGQVDLISCS